MSTIPLAPEAADEILTTRRLAAPRALVFKAWTTPAHVDAWWGPTGFRTKTTEMRVAPGGVWRFTMHGPDGTVWPNRITYLEVVAPERLVYEHDHDGGSAPGFHATVTFDEDGDGTFLAMRARFASAEVRAHLAATVKAVEGGRQTVDRLAAYVAGMLAAGGA